MKSHNNQKLLERYGKKTTWILGDPDDLSDQNREEKVKYSVRFRSTSQVQTLQHVTVLPKVKIRQKNQLYGLLI